MAGRLILWDIDGTLVSCGTLGRVALEIGAATAAKLEAVPHVTMSGKTDPQIISEMLTLAGLAPADVARLMPCALAEAEKALSGCEDRLRQEGFVHPGAPWPDDRPDRRSGSHSWNDRLAHLQVRFGSRRWRRELPG